MTYKWKFNDYLQSIYDCTIEAKDKNPVCYYFPVTQLELAENMDLVKQGYKKDIIPTTLFWMIVEKRKKRR